MIFMNYNVNVNIRNHVKIVIISLSLCLFQRSRPVNTLLRDAQRNYLWCFQRLCSSSNARAIVTASTPGSAYWHCHWQRIGNYMTGIVTYVMIACKRKHTIARAAAKPKNTEIRTDLFDPIEESEAYRDYANMGGPMR